VSRPFHAALLGWLVCVGCGSDSPLGPSQADVPRSGQTGAGAAERAPKERGDAGAGSTLVLYDARDRGKLPPGVERQPELAPEVAKLLDGIVSPADEESVGDCQGEEEPTLRVLSSAAGSFTVPAARQAAYIVARTGCGVSDAEATHLVVVEGGRVVLHASDGPEATGEPARFHGSGIRAVVDVDQDGMSELLVTWSNGSRESARLYGLKGGGLKAMGEFRDVYVNGCGAGSQQQVRAQVIHYVAGEKDAAACFSTELFQAPCPTSGTPAPAEFKPVKSTATPAASPSASAEPPAEPS
jgi:hypothetical protein